MIYNNDLYRHLLFCNSILFADDTTIYFSHKDLRYLEWCVAEDLTILADWFKANKLTLNLVKSTFILFKHCNKNIMLENLKFDNCSIPRSTSTKFLGIIIDEKLNWHEQFNSLTLKIKCNIHLLRMSRNFINKHTAKLIYYGHIFSHINYCISVWGNMIPNTSLNRLQKLQDKCIDLIEKNPTCKNKYNSNRILKIKEILLLENCKIGYKIINKQLPYNVYNLIVTDHTSKSLIKSHEYNTRYKETPNSPLVKGKLYNSCFLSASLREIQPFMVITKKAHSINHFILLLKKEILAGS